MLSTERPERAHGAPYSDRWRVQPDSTTLGIGSVGRNDDLVEYRVQSGGPHAFGQRVLAGRLCGRCGIVMTVQNVH